MRARLLLEAAALAALSPAAAQAPGRVVANLDLSGPFGPFGAPSGWRLLATQGPEIPDPIMGEGTAPARVALCLRAPDGGCSPALDARLRAPVTPDDSYTEPHFLKRAAIVRPHGPSAPPLLLVQDASLFSVDGGQVNTLQLLAWRAGRFERVLVQALGGGTTNQEARYIDTGPLRGAVITDEPTSDAPFRYWISVYRPTITLSYRQALRFRSATSYGDGNRLAVIDSEMPNIERRLGLWRRGEALPLPAGSCPRPHLVRTELWCR